MGSSTDILIDIVAIDLFPFVSRHELMGLLMGFLHLLMLYLISVYKA